MRCFTSSSNGCYEEYGNAGHISQVTSKNVSTVSDDDSSAGDRVTATT